MKNWDLLDYIGLAFVILLCLKIFGFVDWSWWFITLPLWALPAIVCGILFLVMVIAYIDHLLFKKPECYRQAELEQIGFVLVEIVETDKKIIQSYLRENGKKYERGLIGFDLDHGKTGIFEMPENFNGNWADLLPKIDFKNPKNPRP